MAFGSGSMHIKPARGMLTVVFGFVRLHLPIACLLSFVPLVFAADTVGIAALRQACLSSNSQHSKGNQETSSLHGK